MSLDTSKTQWDLSPLFDGDEDPRMEEERKRIEGISHAFISKWKQDNSYLTDPRALKTALDEYEAWQREGGNDGREGCYFWLRSAQDENDGGIKAKQNKIEEFGNTIVADMQFFELSLAKIPPEFQTRILSDENLKKYRHFLERLFKQSKYLLSEEAERVMVFKNNPAYRKWVNMTSEFLSKEEAEVETAAGAGNKTFSEIVSLIDSADKRTRDSAAKALHAILAKHSDAAESELNAVLENKKADDLLRGMDRPDLSRLVGDDVEPAMIDALIKTVSDNFSVSSRYYALKAALLGVPALSYHERNVAYGPFDAAFTYDQAVELVYGVLHDMDEEFGSIFKMFVEGGHIDVFPRKNKSSGAFCAYHTLNSPTYLLLNYTNRLRDVTTIAHETGHGINAELMRKKQHALYFSTPMATAEVASTFMEDFVLERLSQGLDDDEQRLSIIMQKIGDEVSTIFRQVACYRFEQELHVNYREKGFLSKEEIGAIFLKHMHAYMGDAVSLDPGSENWWVYWGHIRSYFYVYSYASGLLISKAMQNRVRQDKAFIIRVKEFLSAGSSDSPARLFLQMGLSVTDASFWQQGIAEISRLLDEAEELAAKLGKLGDGWGRKNT